MCFITRFSNNQTSIGSIRSYSSGISKHTNFLSFNKSLYFLDTLFLWLRSITKMISAHSTKSPFKVVSAPELVPQPIAVTSLNLEKTSSPVGLRSLFSLHTNNKFTTLPFDAHNVEGQARPQVSALGRFVRPHAAAAATT